MALSPEELGVRIQAAVRSGARGRLVARGLARGMIWHDGTIPRGAPAFGGSLTADLLDHGYGILGQALQLRQIEGGSQRVQAALVVAAESIESAVRKGHADDARDFHLVIASAAFHLGGLEARSYSLAPDPTSGPNLSTAERILVGLMRRNLRSVREECAAWLREPSHQDEEMAARLASPNDVFDIGDAEQAAMTATFVRATAALLNAFELGDEAGVSAAKARYEIDAEGAATRRFVSLWWVSRLASQLADDLWNNSLHARLPPIEGADAERWAGLRNRFIEVLRNRSGAQIGLWPSQVEAAARAVDPTDDLVVALPTSAGKTRIAELCILRAIAQGKRVVYVTPLRALSAQLERTLSRTFRPLGCSVTALYGASGVAAADIETLEGADIVVATPEKLDFAVRVEPTVLDDVSLVVLDEGHMIGFGTREFRYEVLVQRLLRRPDADARRIVCLSAIFTLGDAFNDFTAWLRSDSPGTPVFSEWRPTRQRMGYLTWGQTGGRLQLQVDGENPFVPRFVPEEPARGRRRRAFPGDDAEFVVAAAKAFVGGGQRVLIYCPQRRSVESLAATCATLNRQGYLPSLLPEGAHIDRALRVGREWIGDDHIALQALRFGVAIHHGLLPRPFLAEIEDLLDRRIVPLVIASPTIAQGLDLSCSVLVFRSIFRYRDTTISPSEFANVRGRVGRAFVDLDGITVYPIYERVRRGFKVDQFERLNRESSVRELESGLVQLIEALARLVATRLGVPVNDLFESVANQLVDWNTIDAVGDAQADVTEEDGDEGEDADALPQLLNALDTAILSTLDDVSVETNAVVAALDAALAGSLWARRLARRDRGDSALANALIRERARWIWINTSAPQRRGYFAAGIGLRSGRQLDQHLDELVQLLRASENALERGDPLASRGPLIAAAEILRQVIPFRFEHEVENWRDLLGAWISGAPVLPGVAGSRAVGFVQDDVVYRLVWAVEAVRVHATEGGVQPAVDFSGLLPLALTYGLPSRSAALLARAGLASREMVMRLLARFPGVLTDDQELRAWVADVAARIDTPFWEDDINAGIWRDFVERWSGGRSGSWEEQEAEVQVSWAPGIQIPAAGSRVRLVHDTREGITYVCDADLGTLGRLALPLEIVNRGQALASVAGGDRVTVRTFAPRA